MSETRNETDAERKSRLWAYLEGNWVGLWSGLTLGILFRDDLVRLVGGFLR